MNIIRFTKLFFLFLISTLFFHCAYYNTLFNAKKEFENGIKIIQKEPEKEQHPQANRHFEATIDKCWKLIEIYSDKSKYADDALLYIIKSEFHLQKYTQARLHANQFISKYPKSEFIPEVYLWLGKLYIKENMLDKGIEYLNKCLTLSDKSKLKAEAYYELGNLAFESEDYQKAIDFFEKALSEKVDKQYAAFIQFYLAESHFQQKKYEDAIRHYKKVEKFTPSLDVEYKTKFNLARSYSAVKKFEEALKILRKMLTAPRFNNFAPVINSEIASIYYTQGKIEDALTLYKEVVRERKSSPGTALASFELGKIYENRLNNVDSAVYYYGEVKKLYSKFDSVEVAENKHVFLSELKKIRDNLKRDTRLVFRLENDPFFRDSLYKAQLEDSLRKELEKLTSKAPDTTSVPDTTGVDSLFSGRELSHRDSLRKAIEDSLLKAHEDSARKAQEEGEDPLGESYRKQLLGEESTQSKEETSAKTGTKQGEEPKKKELERRKLPQIKQDLRNTQFHLAEFFLLQVQDYDSALFYYKKFLQTYQDSVLTPKALYSIYYIYSQPKYSDPAKRDSVANELIMNYPESQFSKKILTDRGIIQKTVSKDSLEQYAQDLFLKAESLYFQNEIDSALRVYQKIASIDTNLYWAAKAQYARAWIFEHNLQDLTQAINEYTILKEKYPQKEFTSIAAKKIAPPAAEIKQPESTPMDSTTFPTPQPETIAAASDTIETQASSTKQFVGDPTLPSIAKTKEYRDWRRRRSSRSFERD
ncbi:MAG: hypothetical protein Kow0042_18750 [Calditrichia bacterium]